MTDVLNNIASLVIILAGVILLAAKWRWVRNETWAKWREDRLWKQADKERLEYEAKHTAQAMAANAARVQEAGNLPPPEALPEPVVVPVVMPEREPFVTYEMVDGSHIDDFQWVTSLEWFDDRDREVRLTKTTYAFVSSELVVLPDPYPVEDDDDDR
jgi:hypothetical protein